MARRIGPKPTWNEKRQEWRVHVRWKDTPEISEYFAKDQYEQACKRLDDIHARKEQHTTLSDSRQKFGDYLDEWLAAQDDIRDTTRSTYRSPIEAQIKPALGNIALRDLTKERIGKLIIDMKNDGYAWQTVRHVFTIVHAALKSAVPDQLAVNPADNDFVRKKLPTKKTVRKGGGLKKAFNDDAWKRLVIECAKSKPGRRLKPIVQLCIATGMRRSELLGLRWCNVHEDFDEPTLNVTEAGSLQRVNRPEGSELALFDPKSESSIREIPLIPEALAALKEQRARQAAFKLRAGQNWPVNEMTYYKEKNSKGESVHVDDFVFTTDIGTPIEPRNLTRDFETICEHAKLEHVLHELRHTTATWMLRAGVPIATVSRILGHASIAVTELYYHEELKTNRSALERIDAQIAAAGG
jgi:integrase